MSAMSKKHEVSVPYQIGYRTNKLKPLLAKWKAAHPNTPWCHLMTQALKRELKDYAGKREQWLLAA